MLFNSFQYWIFFFIVAALFYSVPFRFGKILLLLASYVFYMWWDPRFIVLILTSTVVDYFLGIWLEIASGRRKKLLLAIRLVVNLGILGFFKYYDFFAGSLATLLHIPKSSVVLQVVLSVCRCSSMFPFASTWLAIAPRCSALNFRLIVRVRSYPVTRMTSGSNGTSHVTPGCGTTNLCGEAGEEKGASSYPATCWL